MTSNKKIRFIERYVSLLCYKKVVFPMLRLQERWFSDYIRSPKFLFTISGYKFNKNKAGKCWKRCTTSVDGRRIKRLSSRQKNVMGAIRSDLIMLVFLAFQSNQINRCSTKRQNSTKKSLISIYSNTYTQNKKDYSRQRNTLFKQIISGHK